MKKMYKKISLWEDSVSLRHYPRLEGVADCEVLVIGGGMAGILIASKLAEEGIDVAVVDAGRIGHGVTAGTTAKITSQHGLIYQKLVNDIGLENAGLYLEANEAAIQEYARICEAGEESCGFHRTANYIYSLRGQKVLEAEMAALEQIGCKSARFRSGTSLTLPFENDGAVEFPLQAGFHPLKFLKKITESDHLKNTDFFENSRITALKRWQDGGWEAVSEHGSILADQVVIASHFPFIDRRGMYFIKMHQNRSRVIAGTVKVDESGKKKNRLDGMYKDEADGGLSFREAEGLLLLGGGTGRPGNVNGSWDELETLASEFYMGWETKYRWSAQDCLTLDSMPYIGPYSGGRENGLWVAAGFNKWGMTGSMVSAMVLKNLICGVENPYSQLFRPDRSIMKVQIMVNAAESAANLLKPTVPRCRHLGCALGKNEEEHTWDCPCHGSRYDEQGHCIEGPSTKDLF